MEILVSNPNSGPNIHTINKWFNTAAFEEVPVGANPPGNAGRGIVDARLASFVGISPSSKTFPFANGRAFSCEEKHSC
jgi:hypothetical protein